ncbi:MULTISPECIES: NUDIX hydrolase [unclassified Frankia]|uniref:NUDIX hydrolase n=1 Tax=unclassified Frankia TaxID=2632575 RepID=UPI002AD26FE5|nr:MULTISPECIES: NUDIX domain-containing protein [unclassified Frankia]
MATESTQDYYSLFAVTVDLSILTVRQDVLCALVVERGIEPYRGQWALPGGFVRPDEDLAVAARRELNEETGLANLPGHLEQLATYGAPGRDPRTRVITVAYLAMAPDLPVPVAGTDATASRWAPVDELLASDDSLAFDHGRILADGVERARAKIEYTPLATAFCPPEFTVADLRQIYETVWGVRLDPRNFHRKVTGTPGFLLPTGRTTRRDSGRPAELFRCGPAGVLHPAMLRPTPGSTRNDN